jgi:hypothetical protein
VFPTGYMLLFFYTKNYLKKFIKKYE